MTAPSDTRPRPGSLTLSSSSLAAGRRVSAGSDRSSRSKLSCSLCRLKPQEAVIDNKAMPLSIRAVTIITMPVPPDRWRGRAMMPSPTRPPRPVGSGQRSVTGKSDATPAKAKVPMSPRKSRARSFSSRRRVRSRQPQKISGTRIAMEAKPTICVMRSAATAPGLPRRLWTRPDVAWLRLGSSTDHVAKASAMAPLPPRSARPLTSAARRARNSRTGSGM